MAWLSAAKWPILFLSAFAVWAIWEWVVERPTQTIGSAYLVPAEGPPGTKVDVCYNDIVWYRICPSATFAKVTAADGSPYDMPVHRVSHPEQPTPVKIKHKCREWGLIPNVPRGLAKVKQRVESRCPIITAAYPGSVTIVTPMPPMDLVIK